MKSETFKVTNIALLAMITLISIPACKNEIKMNPPLAKKIPHELTTHGHTRIDDYYWLNDREDPEVISYLNQENEYHDYVMKETTSFQDELYNEIIARIKQTDMSVPYFQQGYFYYTRYEEGKEYPIYCRKKGNLEADEQILLNVNEMAEGYSFYNIGGMSISPDDQILAYSVDTIGRRNYDVYFKTLSTGELLTDVIPLTTGGATWANDNKTVFYSRKDEVTLRPFQIYKHILGEEVKEDKLVYQEDDETFYASVYKTKSREYIMIACGSTLTTEFRFISAEKADDEFKLIQPRVRELEYSVDHYGDKFYIVTNLDAKNFRLMETPVESPGKENWKEIIAHRENTYLDGVEIFSDFLVVSERTNGLINLRVIRWDDSSEYYLNFEEEAYTAAIGVNREFNTDILRYGYTSLTTPGSVYDYNMNTRDQILLKQEEVLGTFSPDAYETKRLYASGLDGTPIPMSLVYKKGLKLNGKNPLLLYGYGSYGITIDPSFSSVRLSLLDRGFVFVIAHVRGGQINGRQWYEDGKLLKKINTFTDFNQCAQYLIEAGYSSPEHLYAMGGSAGGLLMGAVINLRPELYNGIVAAVPFVDVVTTMLDSSVPLTTGEYDEWGNPNDKVYYDYMLSYSPYDNVEAKNYPNMLVTTGLHDSQVQYWEPAKWVAKLRVNKTDDNIIILHTNMDTGHGGASGRYQRYKEIARDYAFILMLEGIRK
jgi:oligopeptidase B